MSGAVALVASLALGALVAAAKPGPIVPPAAPAKVQKDRPAADDPDSGIELLGRPAPPFGFDHWVRGGPMDLASLRGKVVLLRWWTEGCHYCRTTLPVLERLRREHEREGLVVIGVFHPKPPAPIDDRHVAALAHRLGFRGPVAADPQWSTLERYWLAGHPERNWTSVSFLIDREGKIRWLHGGGEYHPSTDPRHHRCNAQYRELEKALATALSERLTDARRLEP